MGLRMTGNELVHAVVLGVVEGGTEFLPVSSTGHLLLLQHFFGLESEANKTFAILIQFGAILALLSVYFMRLWKIAVAVPSDPDARRFLIGVVIAFLPAAVLGVLLRGFIKQVLFNPFLVCCTLIAGGLVLLVIDELRLERSQQDATRFPLPMYLAIGLFQCLAMVPGVSFRGCRAPARPSSARCSWGPTSGPRPSSRSFSPCRRWPGRSPTSS
jgi:undecaprenyl-diphosphatase